jgi:hypothetical protein
MASETLPKRITVDKSDDDSGGIVESLGVDVSYARIQGMNQLSELTSS